MNQRPNQISARPPPSPLPLPRARRRAWIAGPRGRSAPLFSQLCYPQKENARGCPSGVLPSAEPRSGLFAAPLGEGIPSGFIPCQVSLIGAPFSSTSRGLLGLDWPVSSPPCLPGCHPVGDSRDGARGGGGGEGGSGQGAGT